MPIDPLPPPPQRNDAPSDFADKGDAFLAALPAFAVQTEAARLQAVAASEAAPAAVGAANYQGEYAAGTTYTVGQSVSYGGDRWVAKKTNFGITPVDGSDWLRIVAIPPQSGQGGKFLKTDGTNPAWAASMASGYQEFTASGNWAVPADATWVAVHCVAGGGGGSSGASGCGGAGGGGWLMIFRASDLPSPVPVVVGAGGVVSSTAGDGGDSSFNGVAAIGGRGGGNGSGYVSGARTHSLGVVGGTYNSSQLLVALVAASAGYGGGPANTTRSDSSVYGGGGGAGVSDNAGGSVFAGGGGYGTTPGGFPGGGGGTSNGGGSSGANGVVRIWWW